MRLPLLIGLVWSTSIAWAASPASVDLLIVAEDDALLRPLIERLEQPVTEASGAWVIWSGRLAGKSVALTRSEGDPLNAVAATTLAIRRHPPRLIFNFGLARAHDPALHAGDIVLSRSFVAFDGMVSPQKPLGAGSNPLQWEKLAHFLMASGEKEVPTEIFPADEHALAVARVLPVGNGLMHVGVLGSAPQVNREADRIAWLREQWGTSTEDGESADIAGCASLFGVPVFGARLIGDSRQNAIAFALEFLEAWK